MTTTASRPGTASAPVPDTAAGVLSELAACRDRARVEEARRLRLVLAWADLHALDPHDPSPEACFTSPKTYAGEGSPVIDEFCVPELAALLGQTTDSAALLLTEVVELAHRLPRLWARVQDLQVAGWRARTIARTTLTLTPEAAAFVDDETHWCVGRLTPADLNRLLDTARIRFMPDVAAALERASRDTRHVTFDTDSVGLDATIHLEANLHIPDGLALAAAVTTGAQHLADLGSTDTLNGRRAAALGDLARTQQLLDLDTTTPDFAPAPTPSGAGGSGTEVVLHVHIPADAVSGSAASGEVLTGWVEEAGRRVLTADQIRTWCGRPDAKVTVKPVIDLHTPLTVQGYRPTPRQRDHVILRDRTCTFPWCGRSARRADLDHVVPYEPGPTHTDNLAALCRTHHRLKTHSRWHVEMPAPGVLTWTSPHGHTYLRDHTGSREIPPARP